MIKAVIFDFDGVIADSIDVGFTATNNILGIFDKPSVTLEEFREEFGADWKRFYRAKGVSEEQIGQEPELFKQEYEPLRNSINIFDGINGVIHGLMKYYRLGIVSNNHWEFIVDFLQRFGIHNHFSSIVGYMDGYAKPDVKPLMMCLEELGVAPHEVCLIGDTVDEILLGRRAGVAKVIAVSYGYQPAHKLVGADAVVDTPVGIIETIRKFHGV